MFIAESGVKIKINYVQGYLEIITLIWLYRVHVRFPLAVSLHCSIIHEILSRITRFSYCISPPLLRICQIFHCTLPVQQIFALNLQLQRLLNICNFYNLIYLANNQQQLQQKQKQQQDDKNNCSRV